MALKVHPSGVFSGSCENGVESAGESHDVVGIVGDDILSVGQVVSKRFEILDGGAQFSFRVDMKFFECLWAVEQDGGLVCYLEAVEQLDGFSTALAFTL